MAMIYGHLIPMVSLYIKNLVSALEPEEEEMPHQYYSSCVLENKNKPGNYSQPLIITSKSDIKYMVNVLICHGLMDIWVSKHNFGGAGISSIQMIIWIIIGLIKIQSKFKTLVSTL